MKGLTDKVIVVSGGSRGIGRAIAARLLSEGAKVVIASRKQEGLDEARASFPQGQQERCLARATHMGKADEVEGLFAAAVERFGAVHGLVNNAATNPHFGPLLSAESGAIDKTFEVNVKGYLSAIRAFVQVRKSHGVSGTGSVVNIASVVALRAAPMQGVYAMSKAAVLSMSQTLAHELAPLDIRVNAINPGLVKTRFASALIDNPTISKEILDRTPMKRFAEPDEIAGGCAYLLSDQASFVTGASFNIDGGLTSN